MSAAGYILAINLLVAGLFAGAFGLIGTYDKVRVPARWIALSFLLAAANFAVEWSVSAVDHPRLVVFTAFAISLAGLAVLNVGILKHYAVPIPWRLLAGLFVVSLALNLAIYDMPRASFLRVLLYQAPYVAVQATAALLLLRVPDKRPLDLALLGLLAAGALHFLAKPFFAVVFGAGDRPQSYVDSIYALISQSMGAVLIVAVGLMIAVILVRDLLIDATAKSETDALTGLLNRRGFEQRVPQVVRLMAETRLPASIVLCDLDHFKMVNDSYGHAGGDLVIRAFAARLAEARAESHIVGRIGGEEFAVLLPGANVAAARLFAEGIRSAFAAAAVPGLPETMRFAASFGVAELQVHDTMSDMLRRADIALYAAKNAGRNRVRVAPPGARDGGERRAHRPAR
ncbi:GGDEF domain-containing protein [Aquibium sp. A9E412]|uniref:GGDEF domain-containing protein n=1 Tax=Aquibium sp. A9E412 TaxID=2976767 RepID=UPI0025B26D2B|nr:GGDEF domain-containing protein [Aquibium sp. A9E412]MDN2565714.1 GGDEF domain-containing protein [Aquibium sp. A9E412]